jgi:hypothetical protein
MYKAFAKAFDRLFQSLHGFNPEDEAWFMSGVRALIKEHGTEAALEFAKNDSNAVYTTEILIKAGLRGVDKSLLIAYTLGDNEDDVYGAALSLAICGHDEGFALLDAFTRQAHRLSANIHPVADILPDLKFIEDPRATELEKQLKARYKLS